MQKNKLSRRVSCCFLSWLLLFRYWYARAWASTSYRWLSVVLSDLVAVAHEKVIPKITCSLTGEFFLSLFASAMLFRFLFYCCVLFLFVLFAVDVLPKVIHFEPIDLEWYELNFSINQPNRKRIEIV